MINCIFYYHFTIYQQLTTTTMKMFIRFATLGLIAAVVMSSVSAGKAPNGNSVATGLAADQVRAGLAIPVKRTSLSRRKVASILERRRKTCDHHNHKNYHDGDEIKHHYRPRHRHCGGDSSNHCGDSDDYDDYNDEYDFDDEDYYECDECDECDDDDYRYMSWEDYEDETT